VTVSFSNNVLHHGVSKVHFRVRVFENGVPRRIFGPSREEMVGGWRKLHSEKFHKVVNSERKRLLGRSRRRWG
jgi:hypothetical protein